jgi:hypothetical protein
MVEMDDLSVVEQEDHKDHMLQLMLTIYHHGFYLGCVDLAYIGVVLLCMGHQDCRVRLHPLLELCHDSFELSVLSKIVDPG